MWLLELQPSYELRMEEGEKANKAFISTETDAFEGGFLEAPPTPRLMSHAVMPSYLATRETGKCESGWVHSFLNTTMILLFTQKGRTDIEWQPALSIIPSRCFLFVFFQNREAVQHSRKKLWLGLKAVPLPTPAVPSGQSHMPSLSLWLPRLQKGLLMVFPFQKDQEGPSGSL